MSADYVIVVHVADADDVAVPFDWAEHEETEACWCQPITEMQARESESDEDYRKRIIDAYGMWGAFASIVLESSGGALNSAGLSIGVRRKPESAMMMIVHRRPIVYGPDGMGQVESRW